MRLVLVALLVVVPALVTIMWWQRKGNDQRVQLSDAAPVRLAVAAPVNTPKGEAIANAAKLYANQLNRKGGVKGRRLEIVVVDDQPGAEAAAQAAVDSRALAVIGHMSSANTIKAGKIYRENGIVALTPSATNDRVTKDNEWVFSNIFNDEQQGRFLASYVKHGLGQTHVLVLHDPGIYGKHLADVFIEQAEDSSLTVTQRLSTDALTPEGTQAALTAGQAHSAPQAVFVAAPIDAGAKAIKLLREAGFEGPVVGPDALGSAALPGALEKLRSPEHPMKFYTDELFVAMPLIYDTANAKAQQFRKDYIAAYKKDPLWHAGFAYDATQVLAAALNGLNATGDASSLANERSGVRKFLHALSSPATAMRGVTGPTFFAEEGYAPKPMSMAVFNGDFVSALMQVKLLASVDRAEDMARDSASGRVFRVGDRFMSRTNVVYTGVRLRQISAIDYEKATADVEFDLWFRFQRPLDVKQIEFTNAVESIELGEPRDSYEREKLAYEAYRVKGTFRIDAVPGVKAPLEQNIISIGLRHSRLSANEVIFVSDILGMNGDHATMVADLEGRQVIEPTLNLTVKDAWVAQETSRRHILGDPNYLFQDGPTIEQSTLHLVARVAPTTFTIRRRLSTNFADTFLVIGVLSVFFLYAVGRFIGRRRFGAWLWFMECVAWGAVVLIAEVFVLEVVAPYYSRAAIGATVKLFDVLWWGLLAVAGITGLDRLVWTPIETKTGRPIPKVARQFAAWVVIILCAFGVLAFAFDRKITGLLATSGLLAMIIGLAIQMNISNIFSGIVLNLERPFRIGDWIELGGHKGKVVDVSWRATKLQPKSGEVVSIPNSVAAGTEIVNYSFPSPDVCVGADITVAPEHNPEMVMKLIEQAVTEDAKDFIRKVEPDVDFKVFVKYNGVNERAAFYYAGTLVANYKNKGKVVEEIHLRVWNRLNAAGIRLISQESSVHLGSPPDSVPTHLVAAATAAPTETSLRD